MYALAWLEASIVHLWSGHLVHPRACSDHNEVHRKPVSRIIYQSPTNLPAVHAKVTHPTGIIPTYTIKSCHSLRPNLRFCSCLSFLASKTSVEGSFRLSSLECPRRLRLCEVDRDGRASGFGGGWREGKMMDNGERTWNVMMKNRAEISLYYQLLSFTGCEI